MWLCGSFCPILSTVARTVYIPLRKYLFACLLIFRIVERQQIQPQRLRACGIFSIVLYSFRVSFFYMLKVKTCLFCGVFVLCEHLLHKVATVCAPLLSWVVVFKKIFCHFVVFCGDVVGDALLCGCSISNSQPMPPYIKNVLVSSVRPRRVIRSIKRLQKSIFCPIYSQKSERAGVFSGCLLFHFAIHKI